VAWRLHLLLCGPRGGLGMGAAVRSEAVSRGRRGRSDVRIRFDRHLDTHERAAAPKCIAARWGDTTRTYTDVVRTHDHLSTNTAPASLAACLPSQASSRANGAEGCRRGQHCTGGKATTARGAAPAIIAVSTRPAAVSAALPDRRRRRPRGRGAAWAGCG
jgi:hypothetical protein